MSQNKFQTLLLVEDDPNLALVLQESLELQGYQVKLCKDGEEGHQHFLKGHYDLCLIDVMLPKKDGFALARDIRSVDKNTPIIFLTAKSLKEDRIEGFTLGGDDYVTKPFSMTELILRIQAVLKRVSHASSREAQWRSFILGDYCFDYEQSSLEFRSKVIKLTYKETELLRLLCLHSNQIMERKIALNLIWEEENTYTARSMDVYISKLRKYLSQDPRIKIENIHSKGFRLITPPPLGKINKCE